MLAGSCFCGANEVRLSAASNALNPELWPVFLKRVVTLLRRPKVVNNLIKDRSLPIIQLVVRGIKCIGIWLMKFMACRRHCEGFGCEDQISELWVKFWVDEN